jgi:predicted branched-subunit amino acid permease
LSDPLGTASAAVTSRDGFRHGVQELLPAAPGIFAWGLVTGVAMVKSGLGVLEASVLSLLAYAGSAQLAALPLMMSAAPLWLIFLTATIVNLRFVVYSVMMRPQFAHLTRWRRLWLGAFLADIMFVKFSSLLQRHPEQTERVAYFFGGASANWVIWQVSSIAGILAATAILGARARRHTDPDRLDRAAVRPASGTRRCPRRRHSLGTDACVAATARSAGGHSGGGPRGVSRRTTDAARPCD